MADATGAAVNSIHFTFNQAGGPPPAPAAAPPTPLREVPAAEPASAEGKASPPSHMIGMMLLTSAAERFTELRNEHRRSVDEMRAIANEVTEQRDVVLDAVANAKEAAAKAKRSAGFAACKANLAKSASARAGINTHAAIQAATKAAGHAKAAQVAETSAMIAGRSVEEDVDYIQAYHRRIAAMLDRHAAPPPRRVPPAVVESRPKRFRIFKKSPAPDADDEKAVEALFE